MAHTPLNFIRNRFHPLYRLRKIKAFRRLQERVDPTVFTTLPGVNFKVACKLMRDASWIASASALELEPEFVSAFIHVVAERNPKTFWDVGANIGFYSWLFLSQTRALKSGNTDDDSQVRLFEPDAINFRLLQQTVAKNALTSVASIENAAASDADGDLSFLVDAASGATGCISDFKGGEKSLHGSYGMNRTITVRGKKLDTVFEETGEAPDLLKIDVEGAEGVVFAGAERLFTLTRPVILMECYDVDKMQFLRDRNYAISNIDATNYLCLPR